MPAAAPFPAAAPRWLPRRWRLLPRLSSAGCVPCAGGPAPVAPLATAPVQPHEGRTPRACRRDTHTIARGRPTHFDDDADGPPWVEEPDDPVEESVQTSRRVVEVPVRDPGPATRLDRLREPGEVHPCVSRCSAHEGDFWFDAIQQLAKAETITALVRELGLQSQLVARDAGQWLLRVERESLNQGNTRDRLATALTSGPRGASGGGNRPGGRFGRAAQCAAAAARRQHARPSRIIRDDPFVQTMMRDFGGKIVPGTSESHCRLGSPRFIFSSHQELKEHHVQQRTTRRPHEAGPGDAGQPEERPRTSWHSSK